MRLDLRYTTRFDYAVEAVGSHNELRACPASDGRQHLAHYRVTTAPSSRVVSYTDYWGTRVDTFGVRAPHRHLEVVAEATVETAPAPTLAASPRVEQVRDPAFRETHLEYLEPTAHTDWGAGVVAEAQARAASAGPDLVGLVLALHRTVGTSYRYAPGATYVGVEVEEVVRRREGVCQDFAHLVVALCRSLGIPARYVSGYLFAADERVGTEPDADEVSVQTHAWVEVAVPGFGWFGLDPTNQQEVGPRHVKIGHGRDYDDVTPLRGVYLGGAGHRLQASVRIRRLAAQQQQ